MCPFLYGESQYFTKDSMTQQYDYELVVIGAGSGGLSAAKRAAKLGKKVAIIEKNVIGGTCANRGCIPTKLMTYAAGFAKQRAVSKDYGWDVDKSDSQRAFDWPTFKQAMDAHIADIRDSITESLEGVEIVRGKAEFVDAHTLQVGDRKVTAEFVLLAVGGRPKMPDIPGIEYAIDSRDAISFDTLPESLIVVGGGYIGVELAQIFCSFGCKVTLVESNPFVLDGFDQDIQQRTKQFLVDDGVEVLDDARLKEIGKGPDGLVATLSDGTTVSAQKVLCALGREANTDTLNLEATEVATEKGMVVVGEGGRTQVPNIFAIGDCTATMLLTPVAKAEGSAAVSTMFEGRQVSIDYDWVPTAVFTHPEVAMVGLLERGAREQSEKIEVISKAFSPLKYAMSDDSMEAFIKLVVDSTSGQVLGIHMLAPRAADIVQALVPALKKGLTVSELQETIAIHPSTGEEVFCS